MNITRRSFLGTGAVALGLACVPRVLVHAAGSLDDVAGQNRLVVVQLTGGNDGLNTVIPFTNDTYRRLRPSLAQPADAVLKLGSSAPDLALHPQLGGLLELWERGVVAIVPGVGYPDPDRSHSRSMDIWHTAQRQGELPDEGWLGKVLAPDGERGAFHIGAPTLPLALVGERAVPSIESLDFLDELASPRGQELRRMLRALHRRERQGPEEQVRQHATAAIAQLERLLEVRDRAVPVAYPKTPLGRRLRLAGQLITAEDPSAIYYLSRDGFDTHALQRDAHATLLGEIGGALAAFWKHLEARGHDRRVTVLVFSEFGRRVAENGSFGTDHGAAAPVLLISGRIRAGVHGAYPSLDDLDDGDLRHSVDFRRVYATVLEHALGVQPGVVLPAEFTSLPLYR